MCEMCQQTHTFQFPLYLIRPFVVSLLHSHNLCYATLLLLPPSREERCITTQVMAVRLAWVSGVSGGKGERWKRKRERALLPPPPSPIKNLVSPIPLGRPDTQATVRQTRSWLVGRTLCKPPCYTSYTLSFVPHKKRNLTLPHTFQLCPWVPPRPNECLNEPIAKSAAITNHCTKEKWRPISSEWIVFSQHVFLVSAVLFLVSYLSLLCPSTELHSLWNITGSFW